MKLSNLIYCGFLCVFLGATASASPRVAAGMDYLIDMQNEFEFIDDRFEGKWKNTYEWSGLFCSNRLTLGARLDGKIDALDFKMGEGEALEMDARITNIVGRIRGTGRSPATFCYDVNVGTWAEVEQLNATGLVWMNEDEETGELDIKVDIKQTRVSELEFGMGILNWVEPQLRYFFNQALAAVWKTQFGDWLEGELAKLMEKKFGEEGGDE